MFLPPSVIVELRRDGTTNGEKKRDQKPRDQCRTK
jgi:hypothetical protein